MITYNDVYEAARKERYSEQLQQISPNFILDLSNYLKEKKEIASKHDDIFSEVIVKTKKQLENARMLFRELMRRRRKKILDLVLVATETGISKQDSDNMFDFEKTLFEDLMKCIDFSEKKFNDILSGKGAVSNNELVIFSEDVSEFIGLDGESIGPYKKGEMVHISKEIANILVDGGKAEFV
jgi:DNA replication initiation complex subunit (GINS family)